MAFGDMTGSCVVAGALLLLQRWLGSSSFVSQPSPSQLFPFDFDFDYLDLFRVFWSALAANNKKGHPEGTTSRAFKLPWFDIPVLFWILRLLVRVLGAPLRLTSTTG